MMGRFVVACAAMCALFLDMPSGLAADNVPNRPDRSDAVDAAAVNRLDGASLQAVQDKLRSKTAVINGTIGLDGVHHFYGTTPLGQDRSVRYWTASSSIKGKPVSGPTTFPEKPINNDGDDRDPELASTARPNLDYAAMDDIALASLPAPVYGDESDLDISGTVSTMLRNRDSGFNSDSDSAPMWSDMATREDPIDDAPLDIFDNAATAPPGAAMVTHAVQIAMRASHNAADMTFDRAVGYGSVLVDVAAGTGSDAGYAADILNATVLNRIWVGGIGQWENARDRGDFSGYRYDAHGFAAGYDRAVRNVILGGTYSYTTGDYQDKAAAAHDSTIDNHAFTLYASYHHRSGLFGTVVAGYTFSENDIKELRGGDWTKQDFNTSTWYFGGKVGYQYTPFENFSLTPTVGLGYIDARSSAHDDVQAGNTEHRFNRLSANTAFVPVEVRAAYTHRFGPGHELGIRAKGGYSYNFDTTAPHGTVYQYSPSGGTGIVAAGRDTGHSTWSGGVGVRYGYNRFGVAFDYEYVTSRDNDSHRLMLTAMARF